VITEQKVFSISYLYDFAYECIDTVGNVACKNCPRNDLLCAKWDIKPDSVAHLVSKYNIDNDWLASSGFMAVATLRHKEALACLFLERVPRDKI